MIVIYDSWYFFKEKLKFHRGDVKYIHEVIMNLGKLITTQKINEEIDKDLLKQ